MRAALLFLAFGAAAQAQTYYYTDNFASYNAGAWTAAPAGVSFGASGLTSNNASWMGEKMSALNNGGDSYRCEIKATFGWLAGGNWSQSTDLYLGYYKLAFHNGDFTVYLITGGSQYTLSQSYFNYTGATTVRAILTSNGIRVVIGSQIFWTPTSGYPGSQGVGFTGGNAGATIAQVQLAAGDTTAPNNVTGLSGQGTPMQVDLNWTGASDNAGGSGLLRYNLYRNGVLIASTFGTTYTDNAVSPATTYTYTVKSEDYHANEASGATVAVQTGTSGNAPDPNAPRQTGVRPLGSYWGGAGENIDMRSGNLSFSLPLLKAQGRHGASLGLSLSYNSQNWRQQNGGTPQKLGVDVGYGFGWKLQAGSVIPIYASPGVISHYIFTDSTGAEFRLDVNDGGYWWGKEGVYVAYDPGLGRLRFMDGTFWEMGSTSATSEPDSGTRYPTKVQDSNGNYISLEYKPGLGQGLVNTSARIGTIKDIRSSPGNAYTFNYDSAPHLTSITASIPTGENYSFAYTAPAALTAPFGTCSPPCGNAQMLQSITATGPGLVHSFEYGANGAGELTKVIFPYKGELRWAYGDSVTYSNGQKLREVRYRYLVKQLGATPTTYTMEYDPDTTVPMHRYGLVKDPNGISQKLWYFYLNDSASPYYGLLQVLQELVQGTGAIPRQTWPGYARDAAPHFNRYISSMEVQLDPQAAYTKTMRTEQTLDIYGNVTSSKVFDFGNTTTPRTHHVFSYLNTPAYALGFIFNRQTGVSLSYSGTLVPLTVASYDNYPGGTLTARSGLDLHDGANYGPTMVTRGNRTYSAVVNGAYFSSGYDMTGFATSGQNGNTTTAATPDSKNVVATTITPNGDPTKAMSASFNSIYQMNSAAGPNGASTSIGYDANARPASTTGPHGAYTTFTYDDINRWKMASTNGRWVKTYFDGFGRTIKEQSGNGANIVSTVDTEYDSCGCSPIGKMKRVSRPYVTGPPTNWTTYNYDSQGRVVSVVAPDGVSTTSYLYQGNTTKVTSPSLKWKIHEVDVVGNLTKVTEQDPAGGADFVTNYIYNDKNQLLTVSMPRPTGTQTRTFTYDSNGKVVTATNPETGTVTNTYDAATGLLQQKVDAKNNKVTYAYDSYKRVTEIRRYEWVAGAYVERAEQATRFYYDFNDDAGFGATNLAGRLAYVETYSKRGGAAWNAPGGGNAWETMTFREMYSYTTAGLMTKKRFLAAGRYSPAYAVATDFLESSYTFDNEGRMTGQTYPAAHNLLDTTEVPGVSYTYGFDAMGRPKTMTQGGTTTLISDVAYNAASQPTSIAAGAGWVNAESRAYNAMGQLTSLTSGFTRFEYDFSASANDGRITTARTYASNVLQESISYGYDSLSRLSSANAGAWSASYGYDGFGNLLSTTPSGAGPSAMSVTVNPATNRVNGWTYDANGNVTQQGSFYGVYDVESRLLEATKNSTILYGYGADNRRIYDSRRMQVFTNGDTIQENVTYWSGQRIGVYRIRWNSEFPNNGQPNSFVFAKVEENLYFGSKPLRLGSVSAPETNIAVDRLGSIRRSNKDYFPYGQEAPTTTAGDKEKYATYKHDAATDLSYADQRYYATGAGRFMTADPYKASAGASEPGSWNRFSHVEGDPINFVDPQGLQKCSPSDDFCIDIPPPPPVPTSPLPGLPPLTGPGYIPAIPPGPPGPGPYSAPTWMGFNQSDGNVVRNAQNMASNWVKNKNCDHALQGFGVKSLGDALDGVHVGGKDQNVWNGRNSQLPITFQENGVNYTLPVAEYFSKHSKSVGAIVFSSPQWGRQMFLGQAFFDPSSVGVKQGYSQQAQALLLLHEAVHLLGPGFGDDHFGGSKKLTEAIIDKCFPVIKSNLGGLNP